MHRYNACTQSPHETEINSRLAPEAIITAQVVTIQVENFWVVTPCGVVVGNQRFRCPCCLHLHWVVTPCSVMVEYKRFGGLFCLHLQEVVAR